MATLRSSYEAVVINEPKTALDFAQQVGNQLLLFFFIIRKNREKLFNLSQCFSYLDQID
jgi:hypothetical protein